MAQSEAAVREARTADAERPAEPIVSKAAGRSAAAIANLRFDCRPDKALNRADEFGGAHRLL